MPLLFSINSIPEMAHVPPDEQVRLWRRAVKATRGGCALTVVVAVAFGIGMSTISRLSNRASSSLGEFVAMIAGAVVIGAVVGLVLVNLTYRRARKQLRAELQAAGRCTSCGYDIRATPDRCPECGTPAPPPEPAAV